MSEAVDSPKETMKEEFFLSEDERNIRRGWHRAFFIYYFLAMMICLFNYFILETPPMQAVVEFLGITLFIFSLRYCAYSEFGTKFIGCVLSFWDPLGWWWDFLVPCSSHLKIQE